MEDDNRSREELLRRIAELEEEVRELRANTEGSARSDAPCGQGRFREKYSRRILDVLPDMLTVLSPDGELVDLVSSEETNHVGEPSCRLIGRNISTMLSPEASRNVQENLDSVMASGVGSTSHHDITLDGRTRHYENRIYKLDDRYALCMCRDVTEQRVANEELEKAVRRMEKAEQIASLSHWYYYAASGRFEDRLLVPRLTGGQAAADGRCDLSAFLAYVHTADREKISAQLERGVESDDYVEFRVFVDGKVRYLHSRVIYVYRRNGERIVEGYTQDMTYVAERLRELETLRYAMNNVVEEIFACDTEGRMEFANKQFRTHNAITGELSEYRVWDLDSLRGTRAEWERRVKELRSGEHIAKQLVQCRDSEGRIVTMEIASYLIYDQTKEREIVWFFGRDVSLRVAQEAKIRELNTLMETILNNIPVYLFVKDPGNEFRYLYWNRAFEEYSGIPASRALGSTDYEIFPDPKDADHFRRDDLRLLREGKRIEFDEQYVAVSGQTRTVTTSKALVPVEDRLPLIIGVSWDVTDMKNTQRELIEARVKAEESDRLKSAFLANMSHEIRTPLNAIVGFSKLLSEAGSEEEKAQYAEIVDSNSELLLQLINDILDISKIEAGTLEFNPRPVDLGELCRTQQEIHRQRVREGVELVFDDKGGQAVLMADQNRLAQVFTNLITNAIKFTSKGQIRFGFHLRDHRVDCYVSDTGAGIPEEKQQAIFDRFVKLNDFAAGTGLGLAITKMIVEKMNGTIAVESKAGAGTIFRFSIPCIRPREGVNASAGSETQSQQPADDGRMRTILVAEDIESNYMLVEAFIGRKFRLLRARNGREAVELRRREQPDAVLMDLKMPEMDGFEAARAIRAESPEVPIIAMSAFAFGDDVEKAAAAGCNDYITKPISQKVLLDMLHRYLYGQK